MDPEAATVTKKQVCKKERSPNHYLKSKIRNWIDIFLLDPNSIDYDEWDFLDEVPIVTTEF